MRGIVTQDQNVMFDTTAVYADDVEFWSHHEKVVVVDNHYACIGGLDLCYGRWDTHTHPLADAHPTHLAETLFPGQDYNNARGLDFKVRAPPAWNAGRPAADARAQDVSQAANNGISLIDTPRMPWHDVRRASVSFVACGVEG